MQQAKICYFICDFTRTPLSSVSIQNAPHFVSKRIVFCIRMEAVSYRNAKDLFSVLGQNGLRFGAKQIAIWAKSNCVLGQNGKWESGDFGARRKKLLLVG